MCGITGIFNPNELPSDFKDRSILKSMTLALHHRGPDEKGVLFSDIACLGHARLSIIDLITGQQPMCSYDKRIALVFNGEIYNYLDLKQDLIAKNYTFRTTSDTEVIIYMYKEYGVQMLQRLNGQFAIAIVDYAHNKMLLARDRMGIRPLYYTLVNDTLLFGSTIKSILLHPKVKKKFNLAAFNQLIHLWSTYGAATFFEDIHILLPGEYLEYDQNGLKKKIYWDLTFDQTPEKHSLDEWKELVRDSLHQATALRLKADVPVNAYLSGGLDSSIILKLILDNHKGNLESFSVRFADEGYDETSYQELMTNATGIKNNHVFIDSQKIGQAFPEIIYHAEQPVYRTAPAPLFYLSKLVNRNKYKVVLTGEGADEIGWGYNIFKETLIRYHLSKNKDDERWLSLIPDLYPYLEQFSKRHAVFLRNFYKKSIKEPFSPLFSHQVRMGNGKYVLNFLNHDVKAGVERHNLEENITKTLPADFNSWRPLQKAQYLEMKTLLSGYLLSSQGDRMSMAHSVEARYPFLDHNVVQLFSRMPDELKLQGMNEKHILKETFKDVLPRAIIKRNKQPYRAPEAVSLLQGAIKDRFLNEDINKKHRFFDWDTVMRLENKLSTNEGSFSFNDNFAYVIIAATMIFLELFDDNVDLNTPPRHDCFFHETVI